MSREFSLNLFLLYLNFPFLSSKDILSSSIRVFLFSDLDWFQYCLYQLQSSRVVISYLNSAATCSELLFQFNNNTFCSVAMRAIRWTYRNRLWTAHCFTATTSTSILLFAQWDRYVEPTYPHIRHFEALEGRRSALDVTFFSSCMTNFLSVLR